MKHTTYTMLMQGT